MKSIYYVKLDMCHRTELFLPLQRFQSLYLVTTLESVARISKILGSVGEHPTMLIWVRMAVFHSTSADGFDDSNTEEMTLLAQRAKYAPDNAVKWWFYNPMHNS